MCKFFSFVTQGNKKYYFDWKLRQELLKENPMDYEPDSHSSIAHFFKIDEDKANKFEYNPLTKEFTVDNIGGKDNRALAKRWVEKLDFKTIIEPLVIKPIIHPFKINPPEITEKHIQLLKDWDSVGDSIRDSVWAAIRDSVGDSIRDSVWAAIRDSVWASVWDSVGASVWDSVGDSVRASVWDSVGASVRDSVRAYASSFFIIEQYKYIKHEPFKNPYQPCVDLWEQGLVPSFDGKTWRLHGGTDAKILYELKK